MAFREHDIVRLKVIKQEHGLDTGAVGTIVYLYESGDVAEVEFLDSFGKTFAVATIPYKELESVPVRQRSS